MSEPVSPRVRAMARRLSRDETFLAAALRRFAQSEGLDEVGLSRVLGCQPDDLPLLGLCRRPRPRAPDFRADVDRIAARHQLNAGALAAVVRRADALAALQSAAREESGNGLLMAARDREDDPEHPDGSDDPSALA